jgi:hypothetical protein
VCRFNAISVERDDECLSAGLPQRSSELLSGPRLQHLHRVTVSDSIYYAWSIEVSLGRGKNGRRTLKQIEADTGRKRQYEK